MCDQPSPSCYPPCYCYVFQLTHFSLSHFHRTVRRRYSYWSDRGVPGPRPIFPFGYMLSRAISQPKDFEIGLFKKYGKVYGLYTGFLQTLSIVDADLIKKVLVKDFAVLSDRRVLNPYHEVSTFAQWTCTLWIHLMIMTFCQCQCNRCGTITCNNWPMRITPMLSN